MAMTHENIGPAPSAFTYSRSLQLFDKDQTEFEL